MYQVTLGAETYQYETLKDLRRAYGAKAEYIPDCGTRGDILIRHPLNPARPFRAVLIER